VRSSTNHDPATGSSTRPMWHSSSSSWVLREIRREKPVASVVRSMFTHGSRWAIIGTDVTACTVAAPPSGSPGDRGHPCPKLACRAQRCNDHELIVVGGKAEAALPQRIPNTKAAVAEEPQVRNPGGDTAGQLPRRARTQIVEGRTVNGDRAYTAVVAGRPRRGRDRVVHARAGRPFSGAVSWSAPRSMDNCARVPASSPATSASTASAAAT
jgi:hypothetical protein